jgi:hypothetical protein
MTGARAAALLLACSSIHVCIRAPSLLLSDAVGMLKQVLLSFTVPKSVVFGNQLGKFLKTGSVSPSLSKSAIAVRAS